MKNSKGKHTYSAPEPPKFQKGQAIIIKGFDDVVERIIPMQGKYLYILVNHDGLYAESELYSKD